MIGFEDGFSAMQWLVNANFPDLILLDLDVPRLSGLDFLAQIKKSGFFQDIPVVIISGDCTPETIEHCNQLGVKAYLTKPFDPIKLNAIVKDIFDDNSKELHLDQETTQLFSKLTARLRK